MNRVVRRSLTAGAVALVCACTSDSVNPPIGQPLASFSDGSHEGNPDFFFLPPIFKSPTSNSNFSPGEFNADVRPTVEICELGLLVPPATVRECATTIKTFAAGDITLDAAGEQYKVNWNTDESNLVLTSEYRIRVLLGTEELGFADIDPVGTGKELKSTETGEVIGLVDGRTLPIKFRIENGAACNGGDCDSKTIDLSDGGFVVLETTGDRVDIPAQPSGQVVTVTVQPCENLDIDLPLFGNCLRVTADPPLAALLAPAATVSICSLDPLALPLEHPQQELLTLHRQDDEVVTALPHADDFCETPIGQSEGNDAWGALRNAVAWIFKPATLHASTMVLDVGQGGQTEGFSDFQFALPAKMVVSSLVDQATAPNTAVPSVPTVFVTDADGNPVAGARVHFQITSTGGGSIAPVAGVAMSDGTGHAALTEWVVGAAGSHTVQASGRGIADPENNGPADDFDPFAPAIFHDPEENEAQPPVTLGTGRRTYRATAAQADLIIETLTQLPAGPTDLDVIEWTAVVRNIGTAAAAVVSVQVDLHEVVDGVPGRGIEVTTLTGPFGVPLNPGETASLRRQRNLELNAGAYQLTGTVDPGNQVAESNEGNNTALTRFTVTATGQLLVRPNRPFFGSPSTVDLPLTAQNGLSMQSGTAIQLEVRPSGPVLWAGSDAIGTVGSVNTTGLVAIVQGNNDPATAHELIVTATGASASDAIKINSFTFDHFRRFTTLVWRPVEGAATYEVQIDFGNGCTERTAQCETWTPHFGTGTVTPHTAFALEFVGAQPGRWRVIARDESGAILSTSEYVYFAYSI